jgi:hypothetical protein
MLLTKLFAIAVALLRTQRGVAGGIYFAEFKCSSIELLRIEVSPIESRRDTPQPLRLIIRSTHGSSI